MALYHIVVFGLPSVTFISNVNNSHQHINNCRIVNTVYDAIMTTSEILSDILNSNPMRRGFILDVSDDLNSFMIGETNEIKRLSQRLAYSIVELFELDDCEVMCLGVCPISNTESYAVVRILGE